MKPQITHLAILKHGDGTVDSACGKLRLKGHTGYRWDINLVRCEKCLFAFGSNLVAPRPVPALWVRPKENGEPKTWQGWKTLVGDLQLVKLGNGVSRTAYALDEKRVIKLGQSEECYQCDSEIKRWKAASAEERKIMATIYASGPGWIVMERAKSTLHDFLPGGEEDWRNPNPLTTSLYHDFGQQGFYDLHAGNLGYFGNGVFKVLDYA